MESVLFAHWVNAFKSACLFKFIISYIFDSFMLLFFWTSYFLHISGYCLRSTLFKYQPTWKILVKNPPVAVKCSLQTNCKKVKKLVIICCSVHVYCIQRDWFRNLHPSSGVLNRLQQCSRHTVHLLTNPVCYGNIIKLKFSKPNWLRLALHTATDKVGVINFSIRPNPIFNK